MEKGGDAWRDHSLQFLACQNQYLLLCQMAPALETAQCSAWILLWMHSCHCIMPLFCASHMISWAKKSHSLKQQFRGLTSVLLLIGSRMLSIASVKHLLLARAYTWRMSRPFPLASADIAAVSAYMWNSGIAPRLSTSSMRGALFGGAVISSTSTPAAGIAFIQLLIEGEGIRGGQSKVSGVPCK